jgi:hypothetical protein
MPSKKYLDQMIGLITTIITYSTTAVSLLQLRSKEPRTSGTILASRCYQTSFLELWLSYLLVSLRGEHIYSFLLCSTQWFYILTSKYVKYSFLSISDKLCSFCQRSFSSSSPDILEFVLLCQSNCWQPFFYCSVSFTNSVLFFSLRLAGLLICQSLFPLSY